MTWYLNPGKSVYIPGDEVLVPDSIPERQGAPFKPGFGLSGVVMRREKAKAPRITRGLLY
jgi:hypothetical protein